MRSSDSSIYTLTVIIVLLLSPFQAYSWNENDLSHLRTFNDCRGCNLEDADLKGLDLTHAKLRWAKLKGANLSGAQMKGADLTGVDLRYAKLDNTDLQGSILQGTRLEGVDLTRTRLAGSDLRWADLSHLDVDVALEHIELLGVLLEGARFKNGVRCGSFPSKGGFGCAAR